MSDDTKEFMESDTVKEIAKLPDEVMITLLCAYACGVKDDAKFTSTLATMLTAYTASHGISLVDWVDNFTDFIHFSEQIESLNIPGLNKKDCIQKLKKSDENKVVSFKYKKSEDE